MKKDFSLFTGLLKTARVDGQMVLSGVASSTIQDRHGDIMTESALQSMLRSADGMTIYLNHEYRVPEDVAGSVQKAWITKSGEIHDLHFEILINEDNDRAVKAFNAIDKGTKLGLSIGAMIPEGGAKRLKAGHFEISEVELLETSIVSIPANPRSWVEYARKSLMAKSDVPSEEEDEKVLKDGEDDPTTSPEVITHENLSKAVHEPACNELCEGDSHWLGEVTEALLIEKGKKPAEHQHPHAHVHEHEHDHWDGIKHSHGHAHTHAHPHGDDHEHVDDMEGPDHSHYHAGAWEQDHGHEDDNQSSTKKSVTDPEIADHLAAYSEAATPDEVKSKVTVWPSGKVSVDTTPESNSQEAAPQADPEHEEANATDTLSAALGEMAKSLSPEAQSLLGPTFVATLQTSQQMTAALAVALEKAVGRAQDAERERDEVVEAAKVLTETTEAFITRVAAQPRGRRAIDREAPAAVKALEGIRQSGLFADEFLDMLKGA